MSRRSRPSLAVVILAAGKGKRMMSERPKVGFDLLGWPLVRHVVETAMAVRAGRIVTVVGHGSREVRSLLDGLPVEFATQRKQLGTGHAVRATEKLLADHEGTVLVLLGDVPMVPPETLEALLVLHRRRRAAATLLTACAPDPTGYGRILRDGAGRVAGIREERDATDDERRITEVNTGIMAFRTATLWPALRRVGRKNEQKEYYLTDVPERLLAAGERVCALAAEDFSVLMGVNSFTDLARVGAEMRTRILAGHMERGVRIVDPATTFVDRSVRIGKGTTIFPFTVVTGDVEIGEGCEVGPFSHLRTGTRLGDGAQVGNFVEVKKSELGRGVKAKHLTYLGDAEIGEATNVGCGTITANYDGKEKHRTSIGDRVHVGSGTVFVAPVTVGDDVVTGAGAVVLADRHVKDGDTVVGVPARPIDGRKGRK